jgi:hypothetical protein
MWADQDAFLELHSLSLELTHVQTCSYAVLR